MTNPNSMLRVMWAIFVQITNPEYYHKFPPQPHTFSLTTLSKKNKTLNLETNFVYHFLHMKMFLLQVSLANLFSAKYFLVQNWELRTCKSFFLPIGFRFLDIKFIWTWNRKWLRYRRYKLKLRITWIKKGLRNTERKELFTLYLIGNADNNSIIYINKSSMIFVWSLYTS